MAEIVKGMDNDTGPGWVYEWSGEPVVSGIGTADSTGNWREGKDKTDVVLGIARKGLLIGPVYLHGDDAEFISAWNALAEADRQWLLRSTRPDRDVIDVACRLAGSSYQEAHKMVSKKNTSQLVKDLSDWRQGRNVAGMVLASAHTARMIGEMKPIADDQEFCRAWVRLSEADRRRLLHFEQLDQDVLRVARELADSTRKGPHALVDTPETRRKARAEMGL